MLDFLSTTDVGRWALGAEEDDAVSAMSELEVREWMEEQGAGAGEAGAGGTPLFLPPPDCRSGLGSLRVRPVADLKLAARQWVV